jgi:hypothetical protein
MIHCASRSIQTILLAALHLASLLICSAPAQARADVAVPAPVSVLTAKCEAIGASNFSALPDAPTHIVSAKLIAASEDKPTYCEVEGYVSPQVGILMWLPAEKWNGKFLEIGCGGFCGTTQFIFLCNAPLRKGYACITTDMGHRAKEAEGLEWAYNNTQAVIDFAYRATHVTALAGKAIIAEYYGRKPDKSYFQGCSCGGRQALVEAQRFPWDFDGIIVGAPGINYTDITLEYALRARDLRDAKGKPLFDANSLAYLGKAVIAKCDMNDGLKDGQIGDPRLCKFNPQDYVCKSGASNECLTQAQATAAASYYAEQKSASGDRLGERAYFPGSETSMLGVAETPLMQRTFYEDFYKYMALSPNPGPAWKFENFDLNADYKRLGMIQSLLQADNPDLRRFKAAGGKLIFYHGWSDGGPSPLASIDYYNAVERAMGGRASTQDFLRLFMVPDMDHCMGGNGAWSIDYLDYLEKWVEQGKAPDVVIGAHFTANPIDPILAKPLDVTKAKFTRPVFPYPLRAQYDGKGDPNSASSFKPAKAQSEY